VFMRRYGQSPYKTACPAAVVGATEGSH
jgi:hypothetical protein